MLCPFTSALPSGHSQAVPDWPDGEIQGMWNKRNDQTSGFFWGDLNQVRRATRGTFAVAWDVPRNLLWYDPFWTMGCDRNS
jgi:hypothetical protein